MTAFSDRPALANPKTAEDALRRLADIFRELERGPGHAPNRNAAYADSPERIPARTFPLHPEDFPHPHCADLDDLVGEDPLFSRLRAGSSPYFE